MAGSESSTLSHPQPLASAAAAILGILCLGASLAYVVIASEASAPVIVAALAPPIIILLLAKPRFGLFALIFMAPYVDVFTTSSMGVTFRFNEVFALLLFISVVLHLLRTRQPLQFGLLETFLVGLLLAMAASLVANIGNLPPADRLRSIPTAWIGVTGVLDTPEMATYKKMAQALVAFAAFFVVDNMVTTWQTWRKAVKVLIVSGLLVCTWSALNLVGFLAGMRSALGLTASNVWYSGGAPRITGTLSEPSYFANFLVLIIPITFFCSTRKTTLVGPRWDVLAALFMCMTLLFTFSAGGWVVFTVQLFLMLGLFIRHRLPLDNLGLLIIVIGIVVALGLMAVVLFTNVDYGELATDNWNKLANLFSTGVGSGRRVAPDVGWMMFCDHPLFGVGPGRFRTFEYDYLLRLGFAGDTPASSFYAGVMGELGIFGSAMVVGLFVSAICLSLKWARRAPQQLTRSILWGMAVAFLAMSVHYLAHSVLWWPYVWVLFGLAASGARIAKRLTLEGNTDWEADG